MLASSCFVQTVGSPEGIAHDIASALELDRVCFCGMLGWFDVMLHPWEPLYRIMYSQSSETMVCCILYLAVCGIFLDATKSPDRRCLSSAQLGRSLASQYISLMFSKQQLTPSYLTLVCPLNRMPDAKTPPRVSNLDHHISDHFVYCPHLISVAVGRSFRGCLRRMLGFVRWVRPRRTAPCSDLHGGGRSFHKLWGRNHFGSTLD